jgi:hypothetical protein
MVLSDASIDFKRLICAALSDFSEFKAQLSKSG